jgi:hypothetical protein
LRGLDLEVPAGSICGFLGRNGAGKTTTIKVLLGMAHASGGRARVFGLPVGDERASVEIRRRTGFVSDDKDLYDTMDIAALIRFTARVLPALARRPRARLPAADPSGHWEAPGKPVTIEVDLARNPRGELIGTLGNPAEGEKGLPLTKVVVGGREVSFAITARAGGGAFRATLR